jgi:hypothetical protein
MSKNYTFSDIGIGELRPGVMPRRWEPEGGVNRLRNKIHKESKFADDHKNLPFQFGKPKKSKPINTLVMCDNCGAVTAVTAITVGIVCKKCNKFSTVTEVVCYE